MGHAVAMENTATNINYVNNIKIFCSFMQTLLTK